MGADASTAPLGSSKTKKQIPIFHQMLIVIHGSRKSGKTSLLRRMNGINITPQYTPTKFMQASEIIWHPICYPTEAIKIIVWDVVDKAIDANPQTQRTKQLPDATTVDTFSRADGIIVIYDPRFEESIQYARDILDKAPQDKPILLVMNFSDTFDSSPIIPPQIEPYTNSYFHLMASMKTNQGLAELANWLDLPLNVSLSKIYELRFKESEKHLHELLDEFHQTKFTEETLQQVSQPKEEKDFWAEKDAKSEFGLGPAEVPADFFLDDDENDAKTRQNLEKIKQKLNINQMEDEEDIDEELQAQKLKKKSQILTKEQIANNARLQKEQNQDDSYEDEGSDEYSTQHQQEQIIPQINFDIPVIADNSNNFFDDDQNDEDELNQKIDLEVHEEEEEKPKIKKSKILPKVKPPEIIIKPASQNKPKTNEITKEENDQKEIANSAIQSKQDDISSKIDTSLALEAANAIQFSDDGNSKANNKDDITIPTFDNKQEQQNKTDLTIPAFDNEQEQQNKTDITIPTFENKQEQQNKNNIAIPTFDNEQEQQNKTDITIPTFENKQEQQNKTGITIPTSENKQEQQNKNYIAIPTSENKQEQQNKNNITIPTFDNEQEQQNKTGITIPTFDNEQEQQNKTEITIPTFDNKINDFIDDNQKSIINTDLNHDKLQIDKIQSNEASQKNDIILPTFDETEAKRNEIESSSNQTEVNIPSSDRNQITVPEISNINLTIPSFGNDDNFFSDDEDIQEDNSNELTSQLTKENAIESAKETKFELPNEKKTELPNETKPELPTKTKIESTSETKFELPNETNIESTNETQPELPTKTEIESTKETKFELPKENETTIELSSNQTEKDSQTSQQTEISNDNSIQIPNLFNPSNENDDFFNDNNEIQTKPNNISQREMQTEPNNISQREIAINQNNESIDDIQLNKPKFDDGGFFTENEDNKSNQISTKENDLSKMPKPPPIDFSSSFLSEQKKPTASPLPSVNQSNTSELDDIIAAVRRQEAEKAEKARKDAALIESLKQQEAMKSPQFAVSQLQHQNEYGSIISNGAVDMNSQQPPAASEYEAFGDYQTFDDTPRTSKKKHRQHGSHQRKHRSGKRSQKEDDNQAQQEEVNEAGDETYMSFD